MMNRRKMFALGLGSGFALTAALHAAAASPDCPAAANAEAIGAALLDKYVSAVNAHDTSSFPELFTGSYIQHSGRSPSGLDAQIENFRKIFAATPDHRMHVEDRIIAGDKVVARTTHTATHTQTFRGIPPTGKPFTYRTIDIWRVENGKFAEHWDLTDAAEVLRQLREN
jgi:steroid delta-isomerase-like uncharacterized protein